MFGFANRIDEFRLNRSKQFFEISFAAGLDHPSSTSLAIDIFDQVAETLAVFQHAGRLRLIVSRLYGIAIPTVQTKDHLVGYGVAAKFDRVHSIGNRAVTMKLHGFDVVHGSFVGLDFNITAIDMAVFIENGAEVNICSVDVAKVHKFLAINFSDDLAVETFEKHDVGRKFAARVFHSNNLLRISAVGDKAIGCHVFQIHDQNIVLTCF